MTVQNIYIDHNATTPLKPVVRNVVLGLLDAPGNASSVHSRGRAARRVIENARAQIAGLVNAGTQAVVIFTSGATEANNLALKGAGMERVLVSAIEHPSVLKAGVAHEVIPVLPSGVVDVAALDAMLEGNTRTTLISVMLVNNETGVIQPIEAIMDVAKRRGALVHTDAVQAAGRIQLDLQKLGVDYMTLSSHKIGGPQGAGCLILANCVTVAPQISGGNQEKNMRAGTENLAAIAGFGKAAELAAADMAAFQALAVLRDRLEAALKKIAPTVRIFGAESPRVSNTTMFAVKGMSSETQLIALDIAGIAVSNGSACASGTVKASHVLKAMGVADAEANAALRISLGWNSTENDVECFLREWEKLYTRVKPKLDVA